MHAYVVIPFLKDGPASEQYQHLTTSNNLVIKQSQPFNHHLE